MGGIFEQVDAWAMALVFGVAMLCGWGAGWWRGRRLSTAADTEGGKATDASLALLGLLLAFTFSMSLGKHDQRRAMVVAESNAIGDFYTCASLLKEPTRSRLQAVLRAYARDKLDAARRVPQGEPLEEILQGLQKSQARMTDLVAETVVEGTPIAVPLTNTLNNLTSSHAARLAAVKDRLPWSIVLLLFLGAIVAMVLLGRQQGEARKVQRLGTLSFVLLVTLVVYVTLDLNQPQRGLITVSQEPLERLLASMAP